MNTKNIGLIECGGTDSLYQQVMQIDNTEQQ